jgi:hypothetical protein
VLLDPGLRSDDDKDLDEDLDDEDVEDKGANSVHSWQLMNVFTAAAY